MRVLVTRDYQALSEEAAAIVDKSMRANPGLTLGLPTGQTPLGMYEELIRKHRTEGLDFSDLKIFNLDEYAGISPDEPRSFHVYMQSRFFDHVNVNPSNTHIPDNDCDRYENLIRESGGIDLLIVGIGLNGHIAFNEPGSSFDSRTRLVTLAPETIQAATQEIPHTAITMGIGTILEAREILLLASGPKKAGILGRAVRGPVTESVPASALQLHSNVIVITDQSG